MAYTKKQMEAAKKRTQEAAKLAGRSKKIGNSGRMTMQVDNEAYFAAVDQNGGPDASGKTCWDCPEWRSDMKKRHPETVVKAEDTGSKVGCFTGAARENYDLIFGKNSKGAK